LNYATAGDIEKITEGDRGFICPHSAPSHEIDARSVRRHT
jgi:hypothetical protein